MKTDNTADQKRHLKAQHIKLCPVTPVAGLLGRISGQKDSCSMGSEDSTRIFDPWPPCRETALSPKGSPAKKVYVCVPFPSLMLLIAEGLRTNRLVWEIGARQGRESGRESDQ